MKITKKKTHWERQIFSKGSKSTTYKASRKVKRKVVKSSIHNKQLRDTQNKNV